MVCRQDPKRIVLPNKMTVIVHRLPDAPFIALAGFVKGGASLDEAGKEGQVALMAHLLRHGTETRTKEEIDEALERRGIELSIEAGREGLSFRMSLRPTDLREGLMLLADILTRPTFPEEEIRKERNRLVTALRDELTRPEGVSRRRFYELAYPPDHPFHHAPEGTPESLEGLERDALVSAYRKAMGPQRTFLCLVGALEQEAMVGAVADAFSGWEGIEEFEGDDFLPDAPFPEPQRYRERIPDKTQCWVTMGHKGIRRSDERFYAANILATILGSSWGRLFTAIRDNRGLAYAVGAHFHAGFGEGPFLVQMGVNPKDVDEAIEVAMAEIERVRHEAPGEEEVNDAKNYLLGRLTLGMETVRGVAVTLLHCDLFGLGLDYPQRARNFYDPIVPERVKEVARQVLHPEKMVIAIAGP